MTTSDPADPLRDDAPTSPVDLPPLPARPAPGRRHAARGGRAVGRAGSDPAVRDVGRGSRRPGHGACAPGPARAPGAGPPGPGPGSPPPARHRRRHRPAAGHRPGLRLCCPAAPARRRPPPGPPQAETPPGLVAGIVLVVVGVAFLLIRVADMALGSSSWPLWLIVPGLAMLAGSLAIPPRGGLGLAMPGTIIAIVGGILWVQEAYGLYATWAYAWALVAPTGPGLAMLLYGLARGDHELAADGFRTFLVGIGLFLGFALFFEGVIGISGHRIANLDEVLPYILIGFGVLLVVASLFGGRRDRGDRRDARGPDRRRRDDRY